MSIKSSHFDKFTTNGLGTTVVVFQLQFTGVSANTSGYELLLDKESPFKITYKQTHITNTAIAVLQFSFSCYKDYDSVEIRTRDENAEDQVQKRERVVADMQYNFAVLRQEDLKRDPTVYYEFYLYLPPVTKLPAALYDLMKSELFSDAVIVSSDGKKFNVHRNILACKSDVFKAIFVHDSEESTTGKVTSMFEADVITELLCYIYSEHVNNLESVSDRLLIAADFYKVEELKSICELRLCQNLTVENAIEILNLADLHSVTNLKKIAMRFILINRKKICDTAAWMEMVPSPLMKEVLFSFFQM